MSEKKIRTVYHQQSIPPLYKQVGVYARVSSRSAEQMNSLSAQVSELVRMFRDQYNIRIYDVYIDVLSGANADRPSYQRMLDDCRNRKLDMIVCKSISRFGRNTEELLTAIREIRSYGVNIFFQLENLNTADVSTEYILTIISAFNEAENKSRSENTRMGFRSAAQTGTSRNYTRPCYGYHRGETGELEICETEAANVRLIFDAYQSGASISQLLILLKSLGIPSPTGNESWCKRTIDEMLSNEKYVGDVILMKTLSTAGIGSKQIKNKGEEPRYKVTANHKSIITREQFEAVQREKAQRSNMEPSDTGSHRKSIRYTSSFDLAEFLAKKEE